MAADIKAPSNRGEKKVNVLSIISLALSLFLVVIIFIMGALLILAFQRINQIEKRVVVAPPEFAITNVSYEQEITEYEYIEDTISYRGSGLIIEKTGKDCDYLLLFSRTLVSGGSGDIGDSDYFTIPMIDGFADFATYDYGDVGTITAPQYEFEVLGYIELTP